MKTRERNLEILNNFNEELITEISLDKAKSIVKSLLFFLKRNSPEITPKVALNFGNFIESLPFEAQRLFVETCDKYLRCSEEFKYICGLHNQAYYNSPNYRRFSKSIIEFYKQSRKN